MSRNKPKPVPKPVLQNATVPVLTNDEALEQVDAELTPEVMKALDFLRDEGFAVAAFTPTELRGADPDHIEDAMVQMGWDAIDMNATEPRPEEGKVEVACTTAQIDNAELQWRFANQDKTNEGSINELVGGTANE